MGPTCCRWRKFLARPLGRTAPRWVLVPGDEDHLRIVDKFRGKDELCTFYSVLLITEITPSARSTLSFAPFALIQQMLFLFVFFHHSSQQKLISKDQKWNTGPLAASQLIFPRAQSTRPFLPEKWELLKQYERGSTYFELEGWWKRGPLDLHIVWHAQTDEKEWEQYWRLHGERQIFNVTGWKEHIKLYCVRIRLITKSNWGCSSSLFRK